MPNFGDEYMEFYYIFSLPSHMYQIYIIKSFEIFAILKSKMGKLL